MKEFHSEGPGTVLVAGAHGVIGRAAALRLADDGWNVVTVARRGPLEELHERSTVRHVSVDLLDPASVRENFADLARVTHVVYAAYVDLPMKAAVEPNTAMLVNILDALEVTGATLERVVMVGGGKSYGEHLGHYKTPAKESDPRFLGPIFYNNQEDALRQRGQERNFSWTVLRPDGVFGFSAGSPMNIVNGLAVFAAVSKEEGVPLRFPGLPGTWKALHQATDAGLLARAVSWALTAQAAHAEIFNVTNGDNFRWNQLWEVLAGFFDMPTAEPQPLSLSDQMGDKDGLWQKMVDRHGLRPTPWDTIASWPFVDGWMASDFDMVQSTIKIRQAGFNDCVDSHESLRTHLEYLRSNRYIP
ncbi:SDR family oxidoreductase [Paenarthrobacter nitroguajacolicus]|uniref:SDR family oxidoreductase n=1 Tax=Paenarthrobacter nitroguajacolicus TaxID=211146 RepID=A0A558GWM6_PAENT|nr:SDR family oxidoreductase [Paenarthrobacter nitroguajacolicus]TVU61277.1 SDR family oxidoreductase [Paenarthrobacter nitroguajacolicus]